MEFENLRYPRVIPKNTSEGMRQNLKPLSLLAGEEEAGGMNDLGTKYENLLLRLEEGVPDIVLQASKPTINIFKFHPLLVSVYQCTCHTRV